MRMISRISANVATVGALACLVATACHTPQQPPVLGAATVSAQIATRSGGSGDSPGSWTRGSVLPSAIASSAPRLLSGLDESAAILSTRCAEALVSEPASVDGQHRTSRSPGAIAVYRDRADGVVRIMTPDAEGAGMVVNEPNLIVTNYHVVKDNDRACILFRTSESQTPEEVPLVIARVISVKPTVDLALLRIEGDAPAATPVPLGDLRSVKVGEDVYAIGHPLGNPWSLTQGIVSQVRRTFSVPGYFEAPPTDLEATLIQTQTPISSGNSGGPLFNEKGRVIGLMAFSQTAGFGSVTQGLNMAIAVNEIQTMLADPPPYDPPEVPSLPLNAAALFGTFLPSNMPFQAIDLDGDEVTDAYALDANEDFFPDLWILDSNHNGVADGLAVNLEGHGPPNLYSFDQDEDGQLERKGLDVDADGIVDYWLSEANPESEPSAG